VPEYHRTFGELGPLVKHQLSHRARAFEHFRSGLERMIARGEFAGPSIAPLSG
jgi:XTP/dITP diphosphohydrolase